MAAAALHTNKKDRVWVGDVSTSQLDYIKKSGKKG